MSESQLLSKIRKDARRIAKRFKLRYLALEPEPKRIRSRYGSCDHKKVIRIRLHTARDGRFLQYPNLIHTLCHELAHLRHMDHGRNFKVLNQKILNWAKDQKIYNSALRRV
jgi:predicted metal-dependent hydrolase